MKSKKIIITAILIFSFFCCKKEILDIIIPETSSSISFSECTTDLKFTSSDLPSVKLLGKEDNYLLIKMYNTEFCCGTDSISINQNILDTLINIEIIDEGPHTHCFCPHDLEFVFGPLNNIEYEFRLIESEHAYTRDTFRIFFDDLENLDTTIYPIR